MVSLSDPILSLKFAPDNPVSTTLNMELFSSLKEGWHYLNAELRGPRGRPCLKAFTGLMRVLTDQDALSPAPWRDSEQHALWCPAEQRAVLLLGRLELGWVGHVHPGGAQHTDPGPKLQACGLGGGSDHEEPDEGPWASSPF